MAQDNFENPKLMVVGDSLAQGIRSITVKPEFTEFCYGKLVADNLGWEFHPQKPPRHVLIDLESELREFDGNPFRQLSTFFSDATDNLRAWQSDFENKNPFGEITCYDSIAVGGSTFKECFAPVLGVDGGKTYAVGLEILEKYEGDSIKELFFNADAGKSLTDLYMALNSAAALNPTHDEKYADHRQLDWVRLRKPETLIIHAGHNDGLYAIGGMAQYDDLYSSEESYLKLLDELDQLPPEIQNIIVITYPKISSVANLVGYGDVDYIGDSPYFENYRPRFAFTPNSLSGTQLSQLDQRILSINYAVQEKIRTLNTSARFDTVDTYSIFEANDYKNTQDPALQTRIGDYTIDNRYIQGTKPFRPGPRRRLPQRPRFAHGGFQSLDGMHPSAVGYAVLAIETIKKLRDRLGLQPLVQAQEATILRASLERETLITRYPLNLDKLMNTVAVFRGRERPASTPIENMCEVCDVANRMMAG